MEYHAVIFYITLKSDLFNLANNRLITTGIEYTNLVKSMSSQSVDVLLLHPFTTDITSHSSTDDRNILFLFL